MAAQCVALDRPVLMRHQFRALIQAAEGQELRLMFPMITEVSEFDAARNLLDRELRDRKNGGTHCLKTVCRNNARSSGLAFSCLCF